MHIPIAELVLCWYSYLTNTTRNIRDHFRWDSPHSRLEKDRIRDSLMFRACFVRISTATLHFIRWFDQRTQTIIRIYVLSAGS